MKEGDPSVQPASKRLRLSIRRHGFHSERSPAPSAKAPGSTHGVDQPIKFITAANGEDPRSLSHVSGASSSGIPLPILRPALERASCAQEEDFGKSSSFHSVGRTVAQCDGECRSSIEGSDFHLAVEDPRHFHVESSEYTRRCSEWSPSGGKGKQPTPLCVTENPPNYNILHAKLKVPIALEEEVVRLADDGGSSTGVQEPGTVEPHEEFPVQCSQLCDALQVGIICSPASAAAERGEGTVEIQQSREVDGQEQPTEELDCTLEPFSDLFNEIEAQERELASQTADLDPSDHCNLPGPACSIGQMEDEGTGIGNQEEDAPHPVTGSASEQDCPRVQDGTVLFPALGSSTGFPNTGLVVNTSPRIEGTTLLTFLSQDPQRVAEVVEVEEVEREGDTADVLAHTRHLREVTTLEGRPGNGASVPVCASPEGSLKERATVGPVQLDTQKQGETEADMITCPICMEPWTSTGSHRICSLACGHLFGKSCIKRWLKQAGKKQGKCPHCNRRAKVEDLRNIYIPRIAVVDGEGQHLIQEAGVLRAENEQLKLQVAELVEEVHRSEALLAVLCPEQHDALNTFQMMQYQQAQAQVTREDMGPLHPHMPHLKTMLCPTFHQTNWKDGRQFRNVPPQPSVRKRGKYRSGKQQTSGQHHPGIEFGHLSRTRDIVGFGVPAEASSHLRYLQEEGRSHTTRELHARNAGLLENETLGAQERIQARPMRTFSSLASIGSRGLGNSFVLQDELPLHGAKVFDMDAHSQMLLVSYKPTDGRACSGLTKMSLLALSEGECMDLPPGTGAIRDIRIAPSGTRAPGRLALVASLGKKLALFSATLATGYLTSELVDPDSLESNNVVITYSLQSPSWACAWDLDDPNQVYSGLQNGSVLVFDVRQTAAPVATHKGRSSNPIHTLQYVPEPTRSHHDGKPHNEERGLLSASSSSLCFWPHVGSSDAEGKECRSLSLSQPNNSGVCVSLTYNAAIDTAVASFRPKPSLNSTEGPSASSSFPLSPSQADRASQPAISLLPRDNMPSAASEATTSTGVPIHYSYTRKPTPPHLLEIMESGVCEGTLTSLGDHPVPKGTSFWEQQSSMVGHKSQTVMSRSTIVTEWRADRASGSSLSVGPGSLFAFGDEGSNSVWLWDLGSQTKTQSLIPHQSPVLDIRNARVAGGDLLGCISERTLQLYRRVPA